MDHTIKPTVISFCTGIRGLERGLERVVGPVREVCYVEIEAFICANLVYAMEAGVLDPAPIWTDAKTFSTVSSQFRNKVHIITGGYPCTPFSLAGKRGGETDPRHLWPYLRDAVESIRPVCCFFENVDDHLTMGFDTVYKNLHALGYSVEAGVFTAEEAGAPHERGRLFILAVDNTYLLESAQGRLNLGEVLGIPEDKWTELCSSLPEEQGDQGNSVVEDTNHRRLGESRSCTEQPWRTEIISASKMGNTNKIRSHRSRAHGKRGNEPAYTGEELGHTNEQGSQGRNGGECQECTCQWTSRENGPFSRERWPSGFGQTQQAWEHPRIISREVESAVGLSVDGYSFREDILRALGNSVVEQQAELAFRTLIQKFLNG